MKKSKYCVRCGKQVKRKDGGYALPYWVYSPQGQELCKGVHYSTTRINTKEFIMRMEKTLVTRLNHPKGGRTYNSNGVYSDD